MLWELREHYVLGTFVLHKDMTSRFDHRFQRSQWCNFCSVRQDLVAKATAVLATVPEHATAGRCILDKLIVPLDNFKVLEDPELHGCSRLSTARFTVAPALLVVGMK